MVVLQLVQSHRQHQHQWQGQKYHQRQHHHDRLQLHHTTLTTQTAGKHVTEDNIRPHQHLYISSAASAHLFLSEDLLSCMSIQMADGQSAPGGSSRMDNGQVTPSTRAKRRLGRTGSKTWFNKSFDQSVLQPASKPKPPGIIRRQNSVTDFFQSMLSKSKSHLQDIFTSKKEKPRLKSSVRTDPGTPLRAVDLPGARAEGGAGQNSPEPALLPTIKPSSLHNSCPSIGERVQGLSSPVHGHSPVNLNPDPNPPEWDQLRATDRAKMTSPSSLTAPINMFLVGRSRSEEEEVNVSIPHRPVVKKSSLPFPMPTSQGTQLRSKSPGMSSLPSPRHHRLVQSPILSPGSCRHTPYAFVTLDSLETPEGVEEDDPGRRSVASAPPGRPNVHSAWISQAAEDAVSRTKRALVKSNSDTFAKLSSTPQPLAKASSDGNCFKNSSASSLASSMTSLGNVMISVTDYLFLGSIEAAYNEPLLCKYTIASLIDMTNINPTLVPAHKKTDCPCACVSRAHFRSKLNIGVDDIEWENLEQYFDEINAFINGARKKGLRVLVFSYMGQSRAAAAVIQHLMHHFKMPYREAMGIVRAKRPQIKLNSGFVKALRRLEKRLGLEEVENEAEFERGLKAVESPMVPRGSVEEVNPLGAPPVVRGAWLEC